MVQIYIYIYISTLFISNEADLEQSLPKQITRYATNWKTLPAYILVPVQVNKH